MDTCPLHQEETMPVYQIPDSRTRERVFVQYVPDQRPPLRGRPGAEPNREAGQNLVSEPAHEDEENEQRKERQQGTITWSASQYAAPAPSSSVDSTDLRQPIPPVFLLISAGVLDEPLLVETWPLPPTEVSYALRRKREEPNHSLLSKRLCFCI